LWAQRPAVAGITALHKNAPEEAISRRKNSENIPGKGPEFGGGSLYA